MSTSYQVPPVSVGIITHIPPQRYYTKWVVGQQETEMTFKCLATPPPAGGRKADM